MAEKLVALSHGHELTTAGKRTPPIPELGGRVIKENEFNKAVCDQMAIELKRCGIKSLDVSYTDNDLLNDRVFRANKAKADIYFSVHYNAIDGKFDGEGKDPEGFSVHIYPGSIEGRKLAECVIKQLAKGTKQKNRGIIESNFQELRTTNMPAILTENGFMDNKREAMLMLDKAFILEVAQESCKGICDYFGIKYVPAIDYTVIRGKSIIPIHSLNKATCGYYSNCISGTFQYKNVTSSMFCAWGKWHRKSSTHDWLKQPETVIYQNKRGAVKAQRVLYASEIKDDVVHAIGGLGLHNYDPDLEGFKGKYADVLRDTYHTAIGHDGKEWICVYVKGTGVQVRDLMMNTLKCEIAVMLDGGSIASINTFSHQANLKQVQNNMIQII